MTQMDGSGNELASIKKPGETEHISAEEMKFRIKEIARCKRDICYFAEKYFKIINLDVGLTTIKLYPKQKELLKFFVGEKRCIVLASRQSSKTTTYTIYALWLCMFHCEKKIMLLANKADTALEIMSRIRMAYEYLPSFLKSAVLVWNKGEVVFANRSAIKGFATASDAARGYSANVVIADEFSFVPNNIASKVFESIYPVISSSKNSQFIIVSTPNGADPNNLYYSIWQQANYGGDGNTEGWKAFRFDWWDVPGRDEQWKKNTIASIGERRFSQEFGNEFLASSTSRKLVDDSIIEQFRMKLSEYRAKEIKPKECRVLSQDEQKIYTFRMWREFNQDRVYLASADISEGIGGDSSILYVWDVTNLSRIEMVAAFASNRLKLVEFAFVCRRILDLYGDPWLFAERNGVSAGMIDSLRITYGYQKIAIESKNGEPGIYSHVTVKEKAILWARDMLTTQGFNFVIYDKDLVDEMQSFVKKDANGVRAIFAAAQGAHDDRMMTLIWACWGLNPKLIEKYFLVCDTFKSQLGELYPKMLAPISEYSSEQLRRIKLDPLYREFLDFKDECMKKYGQMQQIDGQATRLDPFKYTMDDLYFGGDFEDGASWNGPSSGRGYVNPNNRMPFYSI